MHPLLTTRLPIPVRSLSIWLGACIALVFLLVVIGGLTRLTGSGLSIVEWKPVTGTLPPLSEQAWESEFAKYRISPEYLHINRGMALGDFKNIFWLEYLHRLLGRLVGLAFLLPLVFFWWKKQLPEYLRPRLAGILLLGAMQGALGWYMVKSGLADVPAVSPYRLAAHLLLAFALFGLLLWSYLDIRGINRQKRKNTGFLRLFATIALISVTLQVGLGALVAGLDAGLIYNTFPDMNGQFAPPELLFLSPPWRNLFENAAMAQFVHRLGAYAVALVLSAFIYRLWIAGMKHAAAILLVAIAAQFTLGVATLLYHVPIPLALLHQAFALILFALCVIIRHGVQGASLLREAV